MLRGLIKKCREKSAPGNSLNNFCVESSPNRFPKTLAESLTDRDSREVRISQEKKKSHCRRIDVDLLRLPIFTFVLCFDGRETVRPKNNSEKRF